MKEMLKVGDLIELTKEFCSGDQPDNYPVGMLGVVVCVSEPQGEVVWVHFQTGYVGALYAKRVRKAA